MKRTTKLGSSFLALALTLGSAACGSNGCVPDIDLTPSPTFDVSAQSYDDDQAEVFARIDLADPGPHDFRATIDGQDEPLSMENGSVSLRATFTTIKSAYVAEVRHNDSLIATINVPPAFTVSDVPKVVSEEQPKFDVTVSPPPDGAVKVSVRVRPGGCLPTTDFGDNVYMATLVAGGQVTFDASLAFGAMSAPECDQPLGVRYTLAGTATSSAVTANGLREQGITIHLVRRNAPDASTGDGAAPDAGTDASAAADAADASSD